MKNIYPVILAFAFLLLCHLGFAQCSASIVTSLNKTQLDCRTTSITLSATVVASEPVTYSWSRTAGGIKQPAGTTQLITATDSGTYTVIVKGAVCNASSSIRITKNTTAPTVKILAIPGTVCSGSPSSLIATGANAYQWIQGSSSTKDTIIVSPETTTSYKVKGTAANGCSSTASYTLIVNPLPDASITATKTTSCQFDKDTLPKITFNGFGGKPPYTFDFTVNNGTTTQTVTTEGNNSSITVDVPTGLTGSFSYKLLSVSDGNGCTHAIQNQPVVVTIVSKPVLISGTSKPICNLSSVDYTAKSSVDGTTFSWTSAAVIGVTGNKNGTGPTIKNVLDNSTNASQSVKYTFTLSVNKGCGSKQIVTVSVSPTPRLASSKYKDTCSGYFFTYHPISSTTALTSFSWIRDSVTGISGTRKQGNGDISDVLTNDSLVALKEKYIYTLTVNSCPSNDTVTVTVYPTPSLTSAKADSVCSGSLFSYMASYPPIQETTVNWTSAPVKGIRGNTRSGTEKINDILINDSSVALKVVYLFTANAGNRCSKTEAVTVTVYPTPTLTGSKTKTHCSDSLFSYHPVSSAAATKSITWTSEAETGVSGNTSEGSGDINDVLVNNSSASLKVMYIFKITVGNGCIKNDTITVTVYPTPGLTGNKELIACSNSPFSYQPQSSTAEQTGFSWTRDSVKGISNPSKIGNGNIEDTLVNNTTQPVKVSYVYRLTSGNDCNRNDTITVMVYPALSKPAFTSFSNVAAQESLSLCASSQNINFNVISPQPASGKVFYTWTSTLDSTKVLIKNKHYPNTVITFNVAVTDTISVTATYGDSACPTSSSQQVIVIDKKPSGISNLKIFKKDSDNILIYPDNSLSAYQWGYDSVFSDTPSLATSAPVALQNQVYQFCIPEERFINKDTLNTKDFYYWVLLRNTTTGCASKIYFNGPFDDKPDGVIPTAPGSNIQLQVIPNPNKGVFEIALKGNMYGNIEAQVYNSAGLLVFGKKFVKSVADMNEKFMTSGLPAGVYFLIVRSSDMKQVRSRFIINP